MARKTATVSVRVEPALKEEAEKILEDLNVSVSDIITVLYKQIIIKQGVPFPIDLTEEDNSEQSFHAYQHYLEYCDKRECDAIKAFVEEIEQINLSYSNDYFEFKRNRLEDLVNDFIAKKAANDNGKKQ